MLILVRKTNAYKEVSNLQRARTCILDIHSYLAIAFSSTRQFYLTSAHGNRCIFSILVTTQCPRCYVLDLWNI